jgi:uncharacterized protein (TIGR02145 family)
MQHLKLFITFLLVLFNAFMFSQTVEDIDGNSYGFSTIGTQTWMSEDLRTSKLNDGTALFLVTENIEWDSLKTPGYCWYSDLDSTQKVLYGPLYNWHAVNSGKLCPAGWHVPSNSEWDTLIVYLGGNTMAGGSLKEIGSRHWKRTNIGAKNDVAFRALPAGIRGDGGTFSKLGESACWWTSTAHKTQGRAFIKILLYYSIYIYTDNKNLSNGFSVRCMKNSE